MPDQATTLTNFWASLLAYVQGMQVNGSGLFGPDSVDYAVDAEALPKGMFPAGPPPFCLIQPGRCSYGRDFDGGGRLTKVYSVGWKMALFVRNITDQSYRSTAAVTSTSLTIGMYALADQVVNLLEQGFVLDASGNLQFTQLPQAIEIGEPSRVEKSNEYLMLVLTFEGTIQHNLPAMLP